MGRKKRENPSVDVGRCVNGRMRGEEQKEKRNKIKLREEKGNARGDWCGRNEWRGQWVKR